MFINGKEHIVDIYTQLDDRHWAAYCETLLKSNDGLRTYCMS